jgi:glyoxylase-like metal-dependent hydrolase (beta-lactamase superfamily II)
VLALGLFAAAGVRSAAQQAPAAATPDVRSYHVQGNVWLVHTPASNVAVQIGDDGVLVVDSGAAATADKVLAEIRRLAGGKTIRYIVTTHAHPDHVGGLATVAQAGRSIISGNFAAQAGPAAANAAKIWAHENTSARMVQETAPEGKKPSVAWPTDTFSVARNDLYFNGEAVQMLHQAKAHTDGDVLVYFRKSDVIAAGDVYINTTFPVFSAEEGGSYAGIIAALNRILELTVPKDKQEGGTYVIPGHGRIADEADVVEYRDMNTIIRDRFEDAIKRRLTLEQIKTSRLLKDYEGRYGATQGSWTTEKFVEAVYRSLGPPQAPARSR